jgi:antitoxin MazE
MTTQVAKWGNSLGVRLPKAVALDAHLAEGDSVDVTVRDGAIVITPARRRFTLDELLAQVTPDNIHGETDWGPPAGKEVW